MRLVAQYDAEWSSCDGQTPDQIKSLDHVKYFRFI